MKHEVITIMAALLCGLSIFPSPAQAKYGGGTGEPNDPYLIYDANQMNAIGADPNDWDKHFKLMADIDLSDYTGPDQPPPPYAYDPYPANGATGISTNADLRWKAGTGAISHDVYFGTGSVPPFVCNQTLTIFDPGTMAAGTKYYWRIDEVNDFVTTTGEIWSFTTFGIPPPPPLPTADIDLNVFTGTSFNIIGYYSYLAYESFTGVFDGNGHTISNFTYTSSSKSYIGLFGCVDDPNAEIKNLGLIEANVYAGTGYAVGLLVGYLINGSITNCYVEYGSVSGGSSVGGLIGLNSSGTIIDCQSSGYVLGRDAVGGLVGSQDKGTITNCHSRCEVSGDLDVGGLVGNNWAGTVANCCSTGDVSGSSNVGGLVGNNHMDCIITNCYSTGNVSGGSNVGGLVGLNYGTCVITNCYSTGIVTGSEKVGGLVGEGNPWITFSFWDIETSGRISSDGGIGKTTAEMQKASTFLGWGCEPIWTIDEGNDYPRLWWENAPGEPITTPSYGGGTGDPNDPYLIYTAEQLNTIGLIPCHLDKHFKLMADIDLEQFDGKEGREMFNIIGVVYENPFTGVFDGNGHTILNFTYDSNDKDYIGLFGYVSGENAGIKNLGLIDPNLDAGTGEYVGALVGWQYGGNITDCFIEGGSVKGYYYVGGLVGIVGYLWGGSDIGAMTNCYSTCTVSGYHGIGGLVGANRGTVTNCYSSRDVSGFRGIGGLTGGNHGTISSCYSNSDVEGDYEVGGLVGGNRGTITNSYANGGVLANGAVGGLVGRNGLYFPIVAVYFGKIYNCYSTGKIEGSPVGGLLGYNEYGEVLTSFWDIETSGLNWSDGGIGKTTAEMQTAGTFLGWGCDLVWTIDEGNDYPRLVWENMQGELITIPSGLYGGGSGEANDPYLIYTDKQLNTIGLIPCHLDKHFKLMADIDLNIFTGTSFNIIGTSPYTPFSGVFDGEGHNILNFTFDSNDRDYIGLFGYVDGPNAVITDLGLIGPYVDAGTGAYVGSLAGRNEGNINNCYVEGGSVTGEYHVGGMVGSIYGGTITNCYSTGSVSGQSSIGGLVGWNFGSIINCYATSGVSGDRYVGGLVGLNYETITNCYSTGSVSGNYRVGGLVGSGSISGYAIASFWDIETSGQTTSDGGMGLPTDQMQMAGTFINAGWDFLNIWWILEGVGYPRHLWEVPVLHAEPEITLGTSNTISWETVVGDVEYYAECAEDADFTSIIYNTGWITETSFEFTGLELGRRYWYSVKARNSAGIESQWSNVESSLQCSLSDAVDLMLDANNLKSKHLKKPYIHKINIAQEMIDAGVYTAALSKLENDILPKTDGCAETGRPDKSDWIITCEEQSVIYPLIIETIEHVKGLME